MNLCFPHKKTKLVSPMRSPKRKTVLVESLAQAAADATKKAYCDEEQTKTNAPWEYLEEMEHEINKSKNGDV